MIKYSKYNICSKITDTDNYFIVNILTGNADIITESDAEKFKTALENHDSLFLAELVEKGYLIDDQEEKNLYNRKYLDFIDSREKDEIQIFFITNYSCNFSCIYCYQDKYKYPEFELKAEVIDAFFNYINSAFAGRKKYITIFGGEPLLSSPKQKDLVSAIIKRASQENLEVCVVTNGYNLEEYVPILREGLIREIQVTLDGTGPVHDSRRSLKNGNGTFDSIVKGIDACLENNLSVNLRMVIDRENIDNLPELARFAINKLWTSNPQFKTQVGRNYELHHCQTAPEKLFNRISLYEKMAALVGKFPHILHFYKPAYSITRFLYENGELPEPLFDSCPACKTEWAFDYTGRIYPCTATVGKADESLGTFYPEVSLNSSKVGQWEARDVTSISECRECNLQLACGGGCGSVSKNRTGNICSTDCRPVKELIELGFSAYFEDFFLR